MKTTRRSDDRAGAILRDALLRKAPQDVLRDALLRKAPQDEGRSSLHPEEPRSGVTKDHRGEEKNTQNFSAENTYFGAGPRGKAQETPGSCIKKGA
jgi:hypothetical protein